MSEDKILLESGMGTLPPIDLVKMLLDGIEEHSGLLTISYDDDGQWAVGVTFLRPSHDWNTAVGSGHGISPSRYEALRQAIAQVGWGRPRLVAQEDDGEQD